MSAEVLRSQWRGFLQQQPTEDCLEACRHAILLAKQNGKILTGEIFHWQNNLFLYFESLNAPVSPEKLLLALNGFLSPWPGTEALRYWVPMMDIFHFNEPQSLEHWRRKTPLEARVGKVGVLRPEIVASYIYYHYGLQEERTFGGDKYEIIALHENLLFGYFELPAIVEEPLHKQRLNTQSMPQNWLDAKIPSHFIPWENHNGSLLPIPSLL